MEYRCFPLFFKKASRVLRLFQKIQRWQPRLASSKSQGPRVALLQPKCSLPSLWQQPIKDQLDFNRL